MRKPVADRIADLKVQKDKLAARLAQLEATAKAADRKRDTRRKIIVGGAVLAALENDELLAARIRAVLAQAVERPADQDAIADLLSPSPPAPSG